MWLCLRRTLVHRDGYSAELDKMQAEPWISPAQAEAFKMPNRVRNVQVSDTTEGGSSHAAGTTIFMARSLPCCAPALSFKHGLKEQEETSNTTTDSNT